MYPSPPVDVVGEGGWGVGSLGGGGVTPHTIWEGGEARTRDTGPFIYIYIYNNGVLLYNNYHIYIIITIIVVLFLLLFLILLLLFLPWCIIYVDIILIIVLIHHEPRPFQHSSQAENCSDCVVLPWRLAHTGSTASTGPAIPPRLWAWLGMAGDGGYGWKWLVIRLKSRDMCFFLGEPTLTCLDLLAPQEI